MIRISAAAATQGGRAESGVWSTAGHRRKRRNIRLASVRRTDGRTGQAEVFADGQMSRYSFARSRPGLGAGTEKGAAGGSKRLAMRPGNH
jgi:hypothetical protein